MTELDKIFFKTGMDFRSWLNENHDSCKGIWMLFYKKHTDVECIEYRDALDEALCYGWIDSLVTRIDDRTYMRKFTPRKNNSSWSSQNLIHLKRLMEQKRMTNHGLSKINGKLLAEIQEKEPKIHTSSEISIPEYFTELLKENQPAYDNFNKLSSSHKRRYAIWITAAKKEETIIKRMDEAIHLLKKGEKLGMK